MRAVLRHGRCTEDKLDTYFLLAMVLHSSEGTVGSCHLHTFPLFYSYKGTVAIQISYSFIFSIEFLAHQSLLGTHQKRKMLTSLVLKY